MLYRKIKIRNVLFSKHYDKFECLSQQQQKGKNLQVMLDEIGVVLDGILLYLSQVLVNNFIT